MDKVNLAEKLAQIPRPWDPRVVGELNVLLFEPAGTLNTGNVRNERTIDEPDRL